MPADTLLPLLPEKCEACLSMCGISLIIDTKTESAGSQKLELALERMQKQQQQRGPDSSGTVMLPWNEGTVAMGSRRLQILDASAFADQPMQRSWRGRQGWLSYNGELYNYADLRNELLQLGCTFRSSSDTEVVHYALLVWGVKALPKFNGMFALAYYEQSQSGTSRLLLARDRWGQKPLYYTRQHNQWLAASELQAILASGLVKKELNQAQLWYYLRYKFARRPHTFFKDVYELEPGHYLLLEPQMNPVIQKFVLPSPAPIDPVATDEKVLERVEELLTDSLLNHLQSDKPVGLFLSGGVDSTLMLALLRQHAAGQVPVCFTIGTAEDSSWSTQDLHWAEKAAAQWDAYHQPLLISSSTVLDNFSELAGNQDQPIADGAWLLTYLLSQHVAAARVKVVLGGAGADEQFAGYHRHSAFGAYLQHQRRLAPLLPMLKSSSSLLPTGKLVPGRQLWQLIKKFGSNLNKDPYQTFLNFTSLAILQQAADEPAVQPEGEPLQWALDHDRQQFLISDVLALSDKASMQWGLEMRAPYLEGLLSDYVAQLPAKYLLKNGKKWLTKALLDKCGGKAYSQRRKEGFGMPFGAWVQQGKTEHLWQWLQQSEHALHEHLPAAVTRDLLDKHRKGKADYNQELMALALLASWMEKHF